LGTALAILLAAAAGHAPAGTRRHDVPDSTYTSLAAEAAYQSVGLISVPGILASGVLVADNYVLTAAHVGEAGGTMTFTLPGGAYLRAWTAILPGWTGDPADGSDLALIRLSTLVLDEEPAALYTATNEVGKTGVVVGFGRTGTGLTGATEPAGTKRAGKNVWDATGALHGYPADVLLADLDNPSHPDSWFGKWRPIALEYLAAEGDSGGGMFLSDGGVEKLAGIVSFVAYRDGEGDSDYGDAMGVVRISSYLDWLTTTLSTAYTMAWVGGSGGFNVAGNWQTTFGGQAASAVPGSLDAALFNTSGSHTVTWPAADLANTRLTVAAGNVTLDLAGRVYTLTEPGLSPPSLVVGEAAEGLTIVNGTFSTGGAFLAPAAGANVAVTLGAGAAWNAGGPVFVGGTDAGPGGAAVLTVAGGAGADFAAGLAIWSGGTVRLAGGTVDASRIDLVGGTLAGAGALDARVACAEGFVDVAAGDSLLVTWLELGPDATLTKTGAGALTLDGVLACDAGSLLEILGGTVWLRTDAGSPDAANLSIALTDAELFLACDQHLDTLAIGKGGVVRLAGAGVLVVEHFFLGGLDLGGMTLAAGGLSAVPEPATLALVAAGGLLALLGRCRRRA
jgi:hypothetical protein